jgi:IS5 family transposase
MKQQQMFSHETQLARLDKIGDPLVRINQVIDWEIFRAPLERAVRTADHSKGGRPPYDVILMYKITMLQQWYGLSDMSAEYQIVCRIDFMRFLGLEEGDRIPDGNTVWDFKEALKRTEADRELFANFNRMLEEKGIITHKGTIIDATFVTVPKRHTTKKDDKLIKAGEVAQDLVEKCEALEQDGEIKGAENVLRQMDIDARWTKKNDESFFGYKDHVKCDSDSKIITNFEVTDASVHDSQVYVDLIDEKDEDVKADSGYAGEKYSTEIKEKYPKISLHVCARAYRNKPLKAEEIIANREISRIRSRIEHIFGYMTRFMEGITTRVHGIDRVKRDVAAKNLAYNLKRYVCIAG